jgi:hypothetical protein
MQITALENVSRMEKIYHRPNDTSQASKQLENLLLNTQKSTNINSKN